LEKKSKRGDIRIKTSVKLSKEEAQKLVCNDVEWLKNSRNELMMEMYHKMTKGGLRGKIIVDYTRDPYTYSYGNVRVTLDHHIRTGKVKDQISMLKKCHQSSINKHEKRHPKI
jgi:hypothetical protein